MQLQTNTTTATLCVDLESAALRTSFALELVLAALRSDPLSLARAPLWLATGKAQAFDHLSRLAPIDPEALSYAPETIAVLRQQQAEGRRIELLTTLPAIHAHAIADHLGLPDSILTFASEAEKAAFLAARQNRGNCEVLTGNPAHITKDAPRATSNRSDVIEPARTLPSAYIEALRPHQWAKNLLVFVPMLLAHRIDEPLAWLLSFAAFAAFCMAASAIYLVNDLLDAPADKKHTTKRHRPIAAGRVNRRIVALMIPPLLAGAITITAAVSTPLLGVIVLYFAITTAYSLTLKRKMLWDVFALAALYTLRIIAGAVAIDKALSFWLLAFSVFTFLSLALVKRFVELNSLAARGASRDGLLSARGYRLCDIETLHQIGIASCFSGVLVFALYINSRVVEDMYRTPQALWLICPALLYLLLRFWMLARRNEMHDDPVVFALRDTRSQLVLLAIFGAVIGAKFL